MKKKIIIHYTHTIKKDKFNNEAYKLSNKTETKNLEALNWQILTFTYGKKRNAGKLP